jgi:hypothetical protein
MKKILAYAAERFQGYDACSLGGKDHPFLACLIILRSALIFVRISKQSFTWLQRNALGWNPYLAASSGNRRAARAKRFWNFSIAATQS